MNQAAKRQQELKDPQLRDDLAAARAVLKKHSTMLLTASKVLYLCCAFVCTLDTMYTTCTCNLEVVCVMQKSFI